MDLEDEKRPYIFYYSLMGLLDIGEDGLSQSLLLLHNKVVSNTTFVDGKSPSDHKNIQCYSLHQYFTE